MVNWPRVADPDTTTSPTLWLGHSGEHQEQLGECLLPEISLVLKWWGTYVCQEKLHAKKFPKTSCSEGCRNLT